MPANNTSLYTTTTSANTTVPANNNTSLYNGTGNPIGVATNISVSGNISAGGWISAGGNVITNEYFIGDGTYISNVVGNYGNSNVGFAANNYNWFQGSRPLTSLYTWYHLVWTFVGLVLS